MVKVTSSPESPPKHQSNSSFFVTISAILAMLSRQASRLKGKAKAKKFLSNISSKSKGLSQFVKKKRREDRDKELNGGIWQKEILMGGKCEPLDFSGVIHYDINGKQTSEVPLKSSRATSFSGY